MFFLVKGTNYENHHMDFLQISVTSSQIPMFPSEPCSQDTPFNYLHTVWETKLQANAKLSKCSNTHLFLPHALFAPWLLKYLCYLLRPVLLMKLSAVLEVIEVVLCGAAERNINRHMKSQAKFPLCLNPYDAPFIH
jgi:hypothetical protein